MEIGKYISLVLFIVLFGLADFGLPIGNLNAQESSTFTVVGRKPNPIDQMYKSGAKPLLDSSGRLAGRLEFAPPDSGYEMSDKFIVNLENGDNFVIAALTRTVISENGSRVIAYGGPRYEGMPIELTIKVYSDQGDLIKSIDSDYSDYEGPYAMSVGRDGSFWVCAIEKDSRRATLMRYDADGNLLWKQLLPSKTWPTGLTTSSDNTYCALELNHTEGMSPTTTIQCYDRKGNLLYNEHGNQFSFARFISDQEVIIYGYGWEIYRLGSNVELVTSGRFEGIIRNVREYLNGQFIVVSFINSKSKEGYRVALMNSETGLIVSETFLDVGNVSYMGIYVSPEGNIELSVGHETIELKINEIGEEK